jgi:uncharacterized protein YutE (UPF0331/DUF86 family)
VTDLELLRKKLTIIEGLVSELRNIARIDRLEEDVRERRFVERSLQLAVQAAIDVALHVIADQRMGEPETNRAAFGLLHRHGWIRDEQLTGLQRMAGFRNVLVHGYAEVDLAIVRRIAERHLGDLLDFVAVIRARIGGTPPASAGS